MKRGGVFYVLAILALLVLLLPLVLADSVDEEIENLVYYAEQYEMGNINYLALVTQSSLIRASVNDLLGSFQWDDHGGSGITADAAEQFFGEPDWYTKWAWDVVQNREVRLDEKAPTFRTLIFDGQRVQIFFEAYPNVYSEEGVQTLYYWTDFYVEFKKDFDLDVDSMVAEIQAAGEAYNAGTGSVESLAEAVVEHERTLWSYLDANQGQCEDVMAVFFSDDDRREDEDRIRWFVDFYSGENLDVELEVSMPDCDAGCQWPWIDLWLNPDFYEHDLWEGSNDYQEWDRDDFADWSIEELEAETAAMLAEAYSIIERVDAGEGSWSEVENLVNKWWAITDALSEKYYDHNTRDHTEAFLTRQANLEAMLLVYDNDIETEAVSEVNYEWKLVVNEEEVQDSWCQEVSQEYCSSKEEACLDGACIYALGGEEICDNGVDDDGDSVADCTDPDCAQECWNYCSSTCEVEGCWECTGQCEDNCNECWGCNWDDLDNSCDEVCATSGCWACEEYCKTSDACTECSACESELESGFVLDPLDCYEECSSIVSTLDREAECHALCDDHVKFICDGIWPQYAPCAGGIYTCDGVSYPYPCETYTCTDVEGSYSWLQSAPCGTANTGACGTNQEEVNNVCVCAEGWYDCDNDGSCDETTVCEDSVVEVCDDGEDNDDDDLIDCADLASCNYKSCGSGYLCYEGGCLLEDEVLVCSDDQELDNGVCLDTCGSSADCGTIEECSYGLCVSLEGCSSSSDCLVSDDVCESGYCQKLHCPEGQTVENKECVALGECSKNGDCAVDAYCDAGQCVVEYNVPQETGQTCSSAGDCGGDRAICSNGQCKEIPEENYDELVNGGLLGGKDLDTLYHVGAAPEDNGNEATGFVAFFTGLITSPTITGDASACTLDEECGANEFCTVDSLSCACVDPYYDCNGDPLDGCESTVSCDAGDEFLEEEEYYEVEEYYEGNDAYDSEDQYDWRDYEYDYVPGEDVGEEERGTACVEDADCQDEQYCNLWDQELQQDTDVGQCFCDAGSFDCNGGSYNIGNDDDGCESKDATCDGERDICNGEQGCGENMYCNEDYGWCDCEEGWYDCDGVWGECESQVECGGCATNDDCAAPTCGEWNGYTVLNYGCYQGNTWTQENGALSLGGGCSESQSGASEQWVGIQMWGDPFGEADYYRWQAQDALGDDWCTWDRENNLRQRYEIEQSLNEEFLDWFFAQVVTDDPEEWEEQSGAIFDLYWSIVDNTRQLAERSECLDEDYPGVTPLAIEYESPYGHIIIWEEFDYVDQFDMEIWTPYMKVWIFPPEEVMKTMLQTAAANGKWPGEGEGNEEGGPGVEELEEIRNDPHAMDYIREITQDYEDGSLDALITIVDEDESVFNVDFSVSEENLVEIVPVGTYTKDADVTIEIDFDFMYGIIESMEKHSQTEKPEWIEGGLSGVWEEATNAAGVFGKMGYGLSTGQVRITPLSEFGTGMLVIRMMFGGGF